jgi:hypothetical protein
MEISILKEPTTSVVRVLAFSYPENGGCKYLETVGSNLLDFRPSYPI